MKQINKTFIIFFGTLFVFIVLCLFIQNTFYEKTGQVVRWESEKPILSNVKIDYSNLEKELSKNSMIDALPKYSIILLKFYNFDSGERVWEKAYVIERNEVKETSDFNKNAEITISLNSKYLEEMTTSNFCEIAQKANQNGDIGFETKLSTTSLVWKFKSMYQYRSCLGV